LKSTALDEFWDEFERLPAHVRRLARQEYQRFAADPFHPGLEFKRVGARQRQLWSVRIGLSYRALGLRNGNEIVWFWIGTHAEYDQLIRRF
jgi:hypothetical protein